jgi:hypothetical protein
MACVTNAPRHTRGEIAEFAIVLAMMREYQYETFFTSDPPGTGTVLWCNEARMTPQRRVDRFEQFVGERLGKTDLSAPQEGR